MAEQQTLSIIKPDAVKKNLIGAIDRRFEDAGLKIQALKMVQISREKAEAFYGEHKGKPFFEELVDFMTSGPVCVQVLAGPNAISHHRELLGATDPQKAEPGTIRADFSEKMPANAAHGSDSPESAAAEIAFFFQPDEIFAR